MRFKATIQYKDPPWYTLTGIEATGKAEARSIILDQAMAEGYPQTHKKITVQEER